MTLSRHQNDALMTSVWPRLHVMWSLIIIMMITGQRLGQDLLILREQNCAGVEKDKFSLSFWVPGANLSLMKSVRVQN